MKINGRFKNWSLLVVALLAAFGLAACGGSGGVAGGGIGGTGKSVGAISATGADSVDVNGVQFATTSATVFIDDFASSASSLKRGMVVAIEGEFSDDGISGTATTVSFNHDQKFRCHGTGRVLHSNYRIRDLGGR